MVLTYWKIFINERICNGSLAIRFVRIKINHNKNIAVV